MAEHELHCDCRIDLLAQAREYEAAQETIIQLRDACDALGAELRRGDVVREQQRAKQGQKMQTLRDENMQLRDDLRLLQVKYETDLCLLEQWERAHDALDAIGVEPSSEDAGLDERVAALTQKLSDREAS